MIRNIKIHNILNIIEVSKSMEPNKFTQKNIYENVPLYVSYVFQILMGPGRCDILSGTTQGWTCPNYIFFLTNFQNVSILKTRMLTSF
jgi:hypothetical protein